MAKKRQYANSNPVRLNPVSFEMIEEKLKKIKPGRKITIFVPRKLTQDNKERYRVVKGEVAAIYSKMVHVCVKSRKKCLQRMFFENRFVSMAV